MRFANRSYSEIKGGYPETHIGLERTINIGREVKRADIIIYRAIIEQIGNAVIDSIEELEKSIASGRNARGLLGTMLE